MKIKLGIFLYNRLFDPLVQSNFWPFVSSYLTDQSNSYTIYLITYENKLFPLSQEQLQLVEKWKANGLIWVKLQWNSGTGVFSKTKDIVQGFATVLYLRIKGCKHFISLASVAGSYLYLYSMVIKIKFFLYSFEPHSEYAIDNKMWEKESLQYKISHYLERKGAGRAKVISSGTKFMEERLKEEWKVKAHFYKIPSIADENKFLFSQNIREETRERLGISNETKVLFYPGKFGDLYYKEEIVFMFKWLWEEDKRLHFLIVTPHSDEEIISLFDKVNLGKCTYTIEHSDYVDIHPYYSASDFGIIAVPPGKSKKFISNIKVGEYLTAGLPFLITEGVSEDYIYATEKQVGVVVKDFKREYVKKALPEIQKFLDKDEEQLRQHCRRIGLEYRGFVKLNKVFKKAVEKLLN